jgi:hypothetical protein
MSWHLTYFALMLVDDIAACICVKMCRFAEALAVEADMLYDIEQKDYDIAYHHYLNVKEQAENLLTDPAIVK